MGKAYVHALRLDLPGSMASPHDCGICAEIEADEKQAPTVTWAKNGNLGRFTNFVNLMDMAAIAVPSGILKCKPVPAGFTGDYLYTIGTWPEGAASQTLKTSFHAIGVSPIHRYNLLEANSVVLIMTVIFQAYSLRRVLQVRWHSAPSIWPKQATLRPSCPLGSPSLGRPGATTHCGRLLQHTMQTPASAVARKAMGCSHTRTRQAPRSTAAEAGEDCAKGLRSTAQQYRRNARRIALAPVEAQLEPCQARPCSSNLRTRKPDYNMAMRHLPGVVCCGQS